VLFIAESIAEGSAVHLLFESRIAAGVCAMASLSRWLGEPRRPGPGENNLWYEDRDSDFAIVFVHGVLSDSRGCWYRSPQDSNTFGTYWPDLLVRDQRFLPYSIYLGGYYTAVDAGRYEIADCAQELFKALGRPGEKSRAVLSRRSIVFLCHSLGGVVVRYMLESRSPSFAHKNIGLALVASPAYGSELAIRLKFIAEFYHNSLGLQLQWGSWSLKDLDNRFRRLIAEKRIPDLSGVEACENHFIIHRKLWPDKRLVVTEESAGRYFGPVTMLRNTDHFTCVKPEASSHPAYEFLQDFCTTFEHGVASPVESTTPATASPVTKNPEVESAPAGKYSCRELHWDVEINSEGDAHNEISLRGLVLHGTESEIELPPAETQAGHMSPYDVVRSCTSNGVTLEGSSEGRVMRMSVRFADRPTTERPADVCFRNYDFNTYCMNMEEYRQKPSWREDGIDYMEKSIDEEVGILSLMVRFPEQITLTGPPFFEVRRPDHDETRADQLTLAYQANFYYSPLLGIAVLRVSNPPAPFYYRISWVLAESLDASTATLTPLLRKRQRDFTQRLLRFRSMGAQAPNAEDAQTSQKVFTVLASFAQLVKNLMDQTLNADSRMDARGLELSLMVLDDSNPHAPVLRIAVGTSTESPAYRDLALPVGEGNAGRAWKSRIVRTFDPQSTTPDQRIYVEVAGRPTHTMLFSIPLIDPKSESLVYALLNLGATSEEMGDLLRRLNDRKGIRQLTEIAHSYVLTRLLEIFNI
jgi:hypothetical protein